MNPLDHLVMDVNERINWKAENDASMLDLFDHDEPNTPEGNRRRKLENWYSIKDIAIELGVMFSTLRQKLRNGEVEGEKIFSMRLHRSVWRIPPEYAERLIDEYRESERKLREWYSSKDVARELSRSVDYVCQHIRDGDISAELIDIRKGRPTYRISPEEFENLPEELKSKQKLRREFVEKLQTIHIVRPTINVYTIDEVSLETEKDLWILAKQGEQEAFMRLLSLYDESIRKSASYRYPEIDFEDKRAFGQEGLFLALRNTTTLEHIRRYAKSYIKWNIINRCDEELPRPVISLDGSDYYGRLLYEMVYREDKIC